MSSVTSLSSSVLPEMTTAGEFLHQEPRSSESQEQELLPAAVATYRYRYKDYLSSSISEIEEEEDKSSSSHHHHLSDVIHGGGGVLVAPMSSIKEEEITDGSLFSLDINPINPSNSGSRWEEEDCVYVAVGKSESSMDAVSWTLKNAVVDESTKVYLVHVFPEIHHIPSPLGKLPKSQVSPEQVENYAAQEREKRRQLLQKYLDLCSASKVKVDTMLVESDMVAKAILDLIPILNMRKLVLGTTKASLRKFKSRRGSGGIADQIFQNAPQFCEIKIVCDGKEVMIDKMIGSVRSPSRSPSPRGSGGGGGGGGGGSNDYIARSTQLQQHQPNNDSFACMCFKPPRVN